MDGLLIPPIDDETRGFWDGCDGGELRAQQCRKCGRFRFPPRPMCPWCQSTDRAWTPLSGAGAVWSFVIPHAPLLPAYEALTPYNVIVVQVDEEPSVRFVGNLVSHPTASIGEIVSAIAIGERVSVVFAEQASGPSMPRWVRIGA